MYRFETYAATTAILFLCVTFANTVATIEDRRTKIRTRTNFSILLCRKERTTIGTRTSRPKETLTVISSKVRTAPSE